jgi:Hypothetical protein (DUF2513)
MQVYEYTNTEMKRDMDLIRELMLHIEENPLSDGAHWFHPTTPEDIGISGYSRKEVGYHLGMLIEEGFIKGKMSMDEMPLINKLTWKGHEFLDDTRDPGIWDKTKKRAEGLTSIGIAFIWEIAKAEIRKKLGLP